MLHQVLYFSTNSKSFLGINKSKTVCSVVHAQLVSYVSGCLFEDKIKYKVSACFFENTY
jgi:hypothetical protein